MSKILFYILIFFLAALLVVIIESIRENKQIEVNEFALSDFRVKKPLKILMLGDLHNKEFGPGNAFLLEKIREQKPDIIMSPGDIILGKTHGDNTVAIDFINALSNIAPTYISKGNHELRVDIYPETYGDMWDKICGATKDNVTWLINEGVELPDLGITITGLDMERYYYKRIVRPKMEQAYLKETLPAVDENTFKILLAHNPDFFPEYANWGADLTFSGHVHGGMMILPKLGGVVSPMVRLFPKYYKGLYENGESKMILTSGLGGHTFKIRVNNKPELVVVNLKAQP